MDVLVTVLLILHGDLLTPDPGILELVKKECVEASQSIMPPTSTGKPAFDLVGRTVCVSVALRASCRSIMGMVPKNMLLNLVMGPPVKACRLRPCDLWLAADFQPFEKWA